MSGVRPSEYTVERIMEMTESKKRRGFRKGLVAVLVVLSVILCTGITANAASDGEVADAISDAVNSIKLRINGKEVQLDEDSVRKEKYVNEEGKTVYQYNISIPDDDADGDATVEYEIVEDEDGVEFGASASGIDGDVSIETDDFVEPTTSVVK